jgi:hypothetical protein
MLFQADLNELLLYLTSCFIIVFNILLALNISQSHPKDLRILWK